MMISPFIYGPPVPPKRFINREDETDLQSISRPSVRQRCHCGKVADRQNFTSTLHMPSRDTSGVGIVQR